MLPDFKALYAPYSGMASLELTFGWLQKECTGRGIGEDAMHGAINETFLEMADGLEFPLDGGDSGFVGVPHACMNLYLLRKAMEMHEQAMAAVRQATEGRLHARILTHIKKEKRKAKKKNGRNGFLDMNRSPVVNGIKKVSNGIKNGVTNGKNGLKNGKKDKSDKNSKKSKKKEK